ncbi:glycine cleavage system P-protein-domain-containing protein [Immersiella caudata]|uniref:Glycine cleavage system P protein n=1 Tax=Immersiella caudata TaxID=314043 RepID=A0AA39XHF0_9PEZI|nr:glycine cleavage system P-protein-domain-containing protein [Immersiella caudata]
MAMSRQAGRMGHTLGASVIASRTGISAPAPIHAAVAVARIHTSKAALREQLRGFQAKRQGASNYAGRKFIDDGKTPDSTRPERARRQFLRLDSYRIEDDFARRHIGPDDQSVKQMLQQLDPPVQSLDDFVREVIPADILLERPLFEGKSRERFSDALVGEASNGYKEWEILDIGTYASLKNQIRRNLIGAGYYGTRVPEVIKRNVLENPAWYTSYTPYQPEISQGRLESLLNFQTLVTDMTGLPIANASLLDEGTAAAEAMTVSLNALPASRANRPNKTFVVAKGVHPQTKNVLLSRAEGFGVNVVTLDMASHNIYEELDNLGEDLVGVLVQYPDTYGKVRDHAELAHAVHKHGALLSVATDLLALTLLKPPGEWGADIAFGNSQRLGVPMGYGGPHAAFFAVQEKHKRKMPGRLVGVSKDRLGGRALRLALQTREQHIRREKATSNVCTAQALLANMSAFYAVYHGPQGLKEIAQRISLGARVLQAAAEHYGWNTGRLSPEKPVPFDTVSIVCPDNAKVMLYYAKRRGINIRFISIHMVSISVDETTDESDLLQLIEVFKRVAAIAGNKVPEDEVDCADLLKSLMDRFKESDTLAPLHHLPEELRRTSPYLTHPVFNTHHSETELLRYIHHLQSKDLSLVHSMIPLGSCTMKLNASTEMALITLPGFANMHPHALADDVVGYQYIIRALQSQLASITGMDAVSLQPNSGAQGEFAGLLAIRKFHQANGEHQRDICLIPVSAHGTNPASAAMAGMPVVPVKCDTKTGNLDVEDLRAKCEEYKDRLGAIMITYPSTYGVFEPRIKEVCDIVHQYGGQVYMDGANMNAQIGLCSPGEIGADVCHLNLHKTFCIPHGGGGPGVGPICVKEHLKMHLPTIKVLGRNERTRPVASAAYGSAGILPISWAYNALMGRDGLKKATQITLLNANYLLSKLKPHYKILYTNDKGRCAHEFILDARPFHDSAGIEAIDIAKRLQDYGFHAPTMSWPVPNTLMIEPTESESKEELDRFVDALVGIRQEIREIEEGKAPREGNVLKMAPHPLSDIIGGDGEAGAKWDRPYSREKAAYPVPWLREKKFWPSVARVNDGE